MTVYGFNDRATAERLKAMAETKDLPAATQVSDIVPSRLDEWVFLTPSGGIPAVSGTTPGTADCTPYYIDSNGELVAWTKNDGSAVTLAVLNVTGSTIGGDEYVQAINVAGKPVAVAGGGFSCDQLCDCLFF